MKPKKLATKRISKEKAKQRSSRFVPIAKIQLEEIKRRILNPTPEEKMLDAIFSFGAALIELECKKRGINFEQLKEELSKEKIDDQTDKVM